MGSSEVGVREWEKEKGIENREFFLSLLPTPYSLFPT